MLIFFFFWEKSKICLVISLSFPCLKNSVLYLADYCCFPSLQAKYWKQYVEAQMVVNNDEATKQIFSRCLLNCLQIPLWYIIFYSQNTVCKILLALSWSLPNLIDKRFFSCIFLVIPCYDVVYFYIWMSRNWGELLLLSIESNVTSNYNDLCLEPTRSSSACLYHLVKTT